MSGFQPKTIDAYARGLRRIGNYFDGHVDSLSSDQLLDYFNDLLGTHSWSAVKLDLYGLKFFYTNVLQKSWNDIPLIKPPKINRIKEIRTSVKSPNMNSYAERFILSARREALDNFIIINQDQLKSVLDQYIIYYNAIRPHQGIDQQVPNNYKSCENGKIVKIPILSGLHHHYYRKAV